MGSWPRYVDMKSWPRGIMSTWSHGHVKSTWRHGHIASCQHGVLATWHHVNMESWPRYVDMESWPHGIMSTWSHGHVKSTWRHGHIASCQHGVLATWHHVNMESWPRYVDMESWPHGIMSTRNHHNNWLHGNMETWQPDHLHFLACNQWQIHVNHVVTCEWEGQGAIPACSSLCSTRPRSPCPPTGPFRSLRRPPSSLGQGTCRPPRVQWLAGPVLPLRPDLLVG